MGSQVVLFTTLALAWLAVAESISFVDNLGDWGILSHCPRFGPASGMRTKSQPSQGLGDDTALNAVQLYCEGVAGPMSTEGAFGSWDASATSCPTGFYVAGFRLLHDPCCSFLEDGTSAQKIVFFCRNSTGHSWTSPVLGNFSTSGASWTSDFWCPSDHVVTAIQTKVQSDQGSLVDDTALNGVLFECAKWFDSCGGCYNNGTCDTATGVCNCQWPFSGSRCQTIAEERKIEILQKYAPRVYLAPNGGSSRPNAEPFLPSSVEWAWQYFYRFANTNDEGRYWLHTKFNLSYAGDYNKTLFYGNMSTATIYTFWVEKNDAYVDLAYFFYYPYNRGQQWDIINTVMGNHISDWEHVTVRTLLGVPQRMHYAVHSTGYTYEWPNITERVETHPVVYSAWGSHGSWRDAGTYLWGDYVVVQLKDYTGKGQIWDTWNRMEMYDYDNKKGLGNSVWPRWMNTNYTDAGVGDPSVPANGPIYIWGNPANGFDAFGLDTVLEDGPSGPADKSKVWNKTLLG